MIFFVPFQVTGGIAGINEVQYKNIIYTTSIVYFDCVDCFNYKLLIKEYLLESLIIFLLGLFISFVFAVIVNAKRKDKN